MNKPVFPHYMQMPHYIPLWIWQTGRFISVGTGYGIILTAIINPPTALYIMWRIIIPLLPLVVFAAPGVWRNLCPMGALNQAPRLFQFGKGIPFPVWAKPYASLMGALLFVVLVVSRKALLNTDAGALGLVLLAMFTMALVGGSFFKGKSGWCATICPLLPLERLYGQTAFVNVPNAYCKLCVGCVKNCYDFNPALANMADQQDSDARNRQVRGWFAGLLPGLILGFYCIPDVPAIDAVTMVSWMAFFMMMSVGLFLTLKAVLKSDSLRLPTLFAAVAFNYFYLFNIPLAAQTLHELSGIVLPLPLLWFAHVCIFILSGLWLYRSYRREALFKQLRTSHTVPMQVSLVHSGSIAIRAAQAGHLAER